jgi:DNA invertase Pin-like site-specific DNA recombinase
VKVVGYSRVSTDDQAKSGLSLAAQEDAIASGCTQRGWSLIDTYVDAGHSGRTLQRPALGQALQAIANRTADGLVVAKLDRLSRSVIDFAALLEWFERVGAVLLALDLAIDTSTPSGRLIANVFASVAQWEREVIGERTRAGLAALRAQGRPISAPCVTDDRELGDRISRLRAEGWTFQRIADLLNEEGVPTRRGGSMWRVSSVQAAAGYRRPPRKRPLVILPTAS